MPCPLQPGASERGSYSGDPWGQLRASDWQEGPPPHCHVPRLCSVDRPLLPGHQSSQWAEKQGPRRVLEGGLFLGPCLWATCTFKTTSMSYVWDLLWLPWAATLPLPPGTPVEGWHRLACSEPYEAGLPLIPRGDDITAFEAPAGAGQVPQRRQVCPGTRNTRAPVPFTPAPAAPAVRPPGPGSISACGLHAVPLGSVSRGLLRCVARSRAPRHDPGLSP